MPRKNSTVQRFKNIPIEELAKMKGEAGIEEMRKGYSSLLRSYYQRKGQIRRAGEFSFAQYQYEEGGGKKQKISSMSRNQLILQIVRLQKFFSDKSSTVQGIRDINEAQDERLFGRDQYGQLNYRMTNEQRKEFWELYNEFLNQEKAFITSLSSEQIQSTLATITTNPSDTFTEADFTEKMKLLKEELERVKWNMPVSRPNILMGTRDDFHT